MIRPILRRIAIFSAPIGLGALAAVHPMSPEDGVTIWNLIHVLQIPLAALLGIAVLLLLRGIRSPAASTARLAVVPWVAFFAAYDGVLGIATGSLTEYGHAHPEAASMITTAATSMVDARFTSAVLPFGMAAFAVVVFGGAAIALRGTRVSGYAALALGVGGVVWTLSHPLIGAPAMLLFLIGAAAVELSNDDTPYTRGAPVEDPGRVLETRG